MPDDVPNLDPNTPPATPPSDPPVSPPAPQPDPVIPPKPAATPPPPAKPEGETFTQKQVNAIAAKEKNDARAALLAELGVETLDQAKARLTAQREAEDAAKGEAQLLKEQAQREANEARAAKAAAETLLLEASITAALSRAGITDTETQSELVPVVAKKVNDDVDANAAVELVKQKLPQLFQAPVSSNPPPSGDARNPAPPAPVSTGGAWERGVERAKKEAERAGVGFNAETFTLNP